MDREKSISWNTIRTVHPGEVFPLFDSTRNGTDIRYSDNGTFGGIASRIRLQTGLPALLNISIAAAPYALPRVAVLTPFDRRQGYPLDQKDFSPRSRYKKIASMKHELAEIVEGLSLVAFSVHDSLSPYSPMGDAFQKNGKPFLSLEIVSLVKSVFLTLTFPNGSSFTSRAVVNTNQFVMLFQTFFPTDTGPLPVEEPVPPDLEPLRIEDVFRLLLPFDAQQLQTIHAKFLLLPELGEL